MLRIFALEPAAGVGVHFHCRWSSPDPSTGGVLIHQVLAKKFWIDTSWPQWSSHFACEYACAVPMHFRLNAVQLVSTDLHHTLNISVEYALNVERRKDVAVCIKPHTGPMKPGRLVEWFEMLQLVGVHDVIVYNTDLTGPARYALQYYEERGVAHVVPFPYLLAVLQKLERLNPKMTGEQRYAVYQQTYLVAMHDCLYRFRTAYRYLLFIDSDETITPAAEEDDMSAVLTRAETLFPKAAGFLFLTAWHWEEAGRTDNNSDLYMQKYSAATTPIDNQPKSAVATDRAISINFHEVLDVPNTEMTSETLDWKTFAYIHHFRGKCSSKFQPQVCEEMLADSKPNKAISRYKQKVEQRARKVLDYLQLT